MTDAVQNGSYFLFADDPKIQFHQSRIIHKIWTPSLVGQFQTVSHFTQRNIKNISFSHIEPDINLKLGSEELVFVETIEDLRLNVSNNLEISD